jgi:hypothetical protein
VLLLRLWLIEVGGVNVDVEVLMGVIVLMFVTGVMLLELKVLIVVVGAAKEEVGLDGKEVLLVWKLLEVWKLLKVVGLKLLGITVKGLKEEDANAALARALAAELRGMIGVIVCGVIGAGGFEGAEERLLKL